MAVFDKSRRAYQHCKERARQRYNYELTDDDWRALSRAIAKARRRSAEKARKKLRATYLYRNGSADVREAWLVVYKTIRFRCVYDVRTQVVVTLLT